MTRGLLVGLLQKIGERKRGMTLYSVGRVLFVLLEAANHIIEVPFFR